MYLEGEGKKQNKTKHVAPATTPLTQSILSIWKKDLYFNICPSQPYQDK